MDFQPVSFVFQFINLAILLAIIGGGIYLIVATYCKLSSVTRNIEELNQQVKEIKDKLNS